MSPNEIEKINKRIGTSMVFNTTTNKEWVPLVNLILWIHFLLVCGVEHHLCPPTLFIKNTQKVHSFILSLTVQTAHGMGVRIWSVHQSFFFFFFLKIIMYYVTENSIVSCATQFFDLNYNLYSCSSPYTTLENTIP